MTQTSPLCFAMICIFFSWLAIAIKFKVESSKQHQKLKPICALYSYFKDRKQHKKIKIKGNQSKRKGKLSNIMPLILRRVVKLRSIIILKKFHCLCSTCLFGRCLIKTKPAAQCGQIFIQLASLGPTPGDGLKAPSSFLECGDFLMASSSNSTLHSSPAQLLTCLCRLSFSTTTQLSDSVMPWGRLKEVPPNYTIVAGISSPPYRYTPGHNRLNSFDSVQFNSAQCLFPIVLCPFNISCPAFLSCHIFHIFHTSMVIIFFHASGLILFSYSSSFFFFLTFFLLSLVLVISLKFIGCSSSKVEARVAGHLGAPRRVCQVQQGSMWLGMVRWVQQDKRKGSRRSGCAKQGGRVAEEIPGVVALATLRTCLLIIYETCVWEQIFFVFVFEIRCDFSYTFLEICQLEIVDLMISNQLVLKVDFGGSCVEPPYFIFCSGGKHFGHFYFFPKLWNLKLSYEPFKIQEKKIESKDYIKKVQRKFMTPPKKGDVLLEFKMTKNAFLCNLKEQKKIIRKPGVVSKIFQVFLKIICISRNLTGDPPVLKVPTHSRRHGDARTQEVFVILRGEVVAAGWPDVNPVLQGLPRPLLESRVSSKGILPHLGGLACTKISRAGLNRANIWPIHDQNKPLGCGTDFRVKFVQDHYVESSYTTNNIPPDEPAETLKLSGFCVLLLVCRPLHPCLSRSSTSGHHHRSINITSRASSFLFPFPSFLFFCTLGPQLRPLSHVVFLLVPIRNTTSLSSEPVALRHAPLESLSAVVLSP
ncbi:putative signal peptide protein [Puccinia sorghi]|uniref:Putative signal peptide protein n=1 Tax=Puccinia sorghi TaxID=27349 RepID=A0A0L6ULC6_9BASI|nr:putative signal peptide protein [Puccinia sorghi]